MGRRQQQPKRHLCQWPSCGKYFNRSDHLQRHILNHSSEGNTCPRCRAHFKRLDLLDRHLMRHKLKDEEAGGIGLGVVETRKRLWRDVDGNLVTKRPSLLKRKPNGEQDYCNSHSRDLNTGTEEGPVMQDGDSNQWLGRQETGERSLTKSIEDAQSILRDFVVSASSYPGSLWSSITPETPNMDDISIQRTGDTFQKPCTRFSSQEWLSDIDSVSNSALGDLVYLSGAAFADFDEVWDSNSGAISTGQLDDSVVQLSRSYEPLLGASNVRSFDFLGVGAKKSSDPWEMPPECLPQLLCTGHCSTSSATISESSSLAVTHGSSLPSIHLPASSSSLEHHQSSSLRFNTFTFQLPEIECLSWDRALDIVTQMAVRTPDGRLVSKDHPLLSYLVLQNYCDLFFIHFNTNFPMIHRPTFGSCQMEPLLLLAVLLLGATYSSEHSYQLAVSIHDRIRVQVLQDHASLVTADLQLIQAILLIECFGMLRAGQQQHGMVHLYHGLMINLVKKLSCPDTQRQENHASCKSSAEGWHKALEAEQRKRLIAMCFLLDAQRALLFSHLPNLPITDLQISVPCRTVAWEADSAEEWQTGCSDQLNSPTLLAVVKSYMSRSMFSRTRELDLFTYMLVLHGLMSISDQVPKKSQILHSEGPDEGRDWRSKISLAYDIWRADFDAYCSNVTGNVRYVPNTNRPSPQFDFDGFKSSTLAIYHIAKMILNVEIATLQTYAGVSRIAGQQVQGLDRNRSLCEMQAWVFGEGSCSSANEAIWHAAPILQQCVSKSHDSKVQFGLHQPWCLYLAALTCWAFAHVRSSMAASDGGAKSGFESGGEPMLWETNESSLRSEMMAVTSAIISRGPNMPAGMNEVYPTRGLIITVSQCLLSLGSDIAKECSGTLARLHSQ